MTAEQRLNRLLLSLSSDLRKVYDNLIAELTNTTARSASAVTPEDFFNIAKHCTPSERKKVEALLSQYQSMLSSLIQRGITLAVLQSAQEQQKALAAYTRMEGKEVEAWREEAAQSFIQNRMKRFDGLNLSDRVWNYTQQTKAEFELAMSQALEKGIASGTEAEVLGRRIRQYLNNPDMMYRRYHLKKVMSDGTKRDVVEWRRRVIDSQGKVRFVKEDLANVGTGVYRSARQNALRVAITETNMAYNHANCKRWSEEPFVLGIRIRLSGNHPEYDICDELQGEYPADFDFPGWHPRCRCSMSSILIDRNSEEWKHLRSLTDKEYRKYQSPNRIKELPDAFKKWCEANKKKLTKAREDGKLPYFVKNNEKMVGDLIGWKNEAQKQGYEGTKLGRKEANEAYKYYADSKPIKLSEEQKRNIQEIAKEMGITKDVKPMTFLEADNGRANINYRKGVEFKENCQSCVVVHEARLRGLDITALGYSSKKDSMQYQLGEHFEMAWINPKTGKAPNITTISGDNLINHALKQMQVPGRYHIGVNYDKDNGHVITAERLLNGKIILYDAQSGDFMNLNEFIGIDSLEILRVDKLLLCRNVLDKISIKL